MQLRSKERHNEAAAVIVVPIMCSYCVQAVRCGQVMYSCTDPAVYNALFPGHISFV